MFLGGSCSGLRVLCGYLAGRTGMKSNLGQPEVQNLGMSTLGNKDICRLDVAMNDPLGVGGVERIGDLNRQTEQYIGKRRSMR